MAGVELERDRDQADGEDERPARTSGAGRVHAASVQHAGMPRGICPRAPLARRSSGNGPPALVATSAIDLRSPGQSPRAASAGAGQAASAQAGEATASCSKHRRLSASHGQPSRGRSSERSSSRSRQPPARDRRVVRAEHDGAAGERVPAQDPDVLVPARDARACHEVAAAGAHRAAAALVAAGRARPLARAERPRGRALLATAIGAGRSFT